VLPQDLSAALSSVGPSGAAANWTGVGP